MLTVALVGADGAGKSTVALSLVDELPYPVRRMYLGVSPSSATHALPTTRVIQRVRVATGRATPTGGPPPLASEVVSGDGRGSFLRFSRRLIRTVHRMSEEAYQESISRWHRSRGRVVVYDRFYPADFHAHDLTDRAGLGWDRRLHAAFLRRCFAEPDLVIVLDAEPDVLWSRKGEGTIAELTQRRGEYLSYASTVSNAVVVRADQPLDQVIAEVSTAVTRTRDLGAPPIGAMRATQPDRGQPEASRP